MLRPTALSRLCAWVLMGLLLFRAGAPGLAATAAQVRGTALVEICSVYGVRTVAVDAEGMPLDTALHLPASQDTSPPAGLGDCALAALPLFELPPPDTLPARSPLLRQAELPRAAPAADLPADADRRWWSGLKQEPPAA